MIVLIQISHLKGIDVFSLRRYINRGDLDSIRNVLTALFARITYTTKDDA